MDDEDDKQQSADDALESQNDIFDPAANQTHLARDYDSPAAPADDTSTKPLPPDHPLTDDKLDEHEVYDEGIAGATDVDAHQEDPDESPQPFEYK